MGKRLLLRNEKTNLRKKENTQKYD